MTTPASFNTAYRCIVYALRDAGRLAEGSEPSSEQLAIGLNRLNDLINLWQTQGLKLFLLEDLPVTLTAALALYTFGAAGSTVMAKPHKIEEAWLEDSDGQRIPLNPLAWEGYNHLGNTTTESTPNSFFVDKQATLLRVRLWPVPDTSAASLYTLHVLVRKQITNFVGLSDQSAFPQEWFIALRWGLADDWATGQPQAIMDRCEKRAMAFREALEDWDIEDASTYFTPSLRGPHG